MHTRLPPYIFSLALLLPLGLGAHSYKITDRNTPPSGANLSGERLLYQVGYSHLDTQWRWDYRQVIDEFLPNTVHENEKLFQQYPNYVFNFSGANRYRMIEEYHPADFEIVKRRVADGHWFPCGNSWEENDALVPSPESLFRNILQGHRYFLAKFQVESAEFMIPDCFGFPAFLPSVFAHSGITGFSTQKLTWGSSVPLPFHVGEWVGPDGRGVIGALEAGNYTATVNGNRAFDWGWRERLQRHGTLFGVTAGYDYFGTGDRGGAPDANSVKNVMDAQATTDGFNRIIAGRADQFFVDFTDPQRAGLPRFQGDLLLTEHSAGSATSQAYMKRWNRYNEVLADAAERAAVAAHLLGAADYPRKKLNDAWGLVLVGQFHDNLPGTSLPICYEFCWNDYIIAMNQFADVLQDSVGQVARALDTDVPGVPLVVYNPSAFSRSEPVEAELALDADVSAVVVHDGAGQALPTQVLGREDGKLRFVFQGEVPSVGFAVFSVRPVKQALAAATGLKVTERTLENARYRVTLADNGDLAAIFDKKFQREMLARPARLTFTYESPREWPAWNMDWADRVKPPFGFVEGPAEFRIVENGPARVALAVTRKSMGSTFTQTYRLAVGDAGERVEVVNDIDWQTKSMALRAEFPLTVTNTLATYNWGLGKVQRGANHPKLYELPNHQWFDVTSTQGDYGVSILNDAKYGSDRPSDENPRLTLLYTPGVRWEYVEQGTQDLGKHHFTYALSGHGGSWMAGRSDDQAEALFQPLYAFRTTAKKGPLGRSLSLLQVDNPKVAVRALKLAEDDDRVVVRLQELSGEARVPAKLTFATGLKTAEEADGLERVKGTLPIEGRSVPLTVTRFEPRTLKLRPAALGALARPQQQPLELAYDADLISSNAARGDGDLAAAGRLLPAEQLGAEVRSEGVVYRLGPAADGAKNGLSLAGQKLALPGQAGSVYLLSYAVDTDLEAKLKVDGREQSVLIPNGGGYLGQWYNRVFKGAVEKLTYSVNNELLRIDPGYLHRRHVAWYASHGHLADKDDTYRYRYLHAVRVAVPAGAKTLTLPSTPGAFVLAATFVAEDPAATTEPARSLVDRVP